MRELSEASSAVVVGPSRIETPEQALESPSLFHPAVAGGPVAYEVKFLLTEEQADAVATQVNGRLHLDPYADPLLGDAYSTTSLYTDTPTFDVYFRTEGYNRDKYRVRRYGSTGPVFVERKTKVGDKVCKHRTRLDAEGLRALTARQVESDWRGGWFRRDVLARDLQPVACIAYERVAYIGAGENGTVRLTFDRRVRGLPAHDWNLEPVESAAVLLADRVICEFKFRVAMPVLFKEIIAKLRLTPNPVSKYRLFVESTGLADSRRAVNG